MCCVLLLPQNLESQNGIFEAGRFFIDPLGLSQRVASVQPFQEPRHVEAHQPKLTKAGFLKTVLSCLVGAYIGFL